jgi:Cu+-exporting ATPase
MPGAGVEAAVLTGAAEQRILIGNRRLFREHEIATTPAVESALARLDEAGQTALLVAVAGQVVGVIGARDRVRPEAHDILHDLKHLGLKDLTILTGDRPAPAGAVARRVHIKQVEAELTPADKAEWVARRQHEGRVVAMVGDGINDTLALATADVGLALGGVGTDIAAEAGSIILMGDPLEPLPETIRLARRTVRVIRQNILLFAFGLNGLAIGLAGLRLLGPVAAAIVHQVGSTLVLLNAIRLLGFERWGEFGLARGLGRFASACRRCHPAAVSRWAWAQRRTLAAAVAVTALLAYLASGIVVIRAEEVGIVQRWGRYHRPLLAPGLHVRWPLPCERVTKAEPERVRVDRIGLSAAAPAARGSIAWNATHGARRDESALYFTGDENLVELAAVVEYRLTNEGVLDALFGVSSVESSVHAAAEASLRDVLSRTPLEAILVSRRHGFEEEVAGGLKERLAVAGLHAAVDRVRVIDAHPPREVVPAYRDVSAAVSDVERFRNDAEAFAAERHWSAMAQARQLRDSAQAAAQRLQSRAEGDRQAFLARQAASVPQPGLTQFRLFWDTLATAYAGCPKLILDPRAAGRRHVWLADPEGLVLGRLARAAPAFTGNNDEPDD